MIIMKLNIIHKKGIIIILAMEGKEVIQEKIFIRGKIVIEVKAKVKRLQKYQHQQEVINQHHQKNQEKPVLKTEERMLVAED